MDRTDILANIIKESITRDLADIEKEAFMMKSKDIIWKQLQDSISFEIYQKKKRSSKRLYIKAAAVLVIIGLLSCANFLMPEPKIHAQRLDFFQSIVQYFSDKTVLHEVKRSSPENSIDSSSTDENSFTLEWKEVSWEEAQRKIDFQIKKPSYLPQGYTLSKVLIFDTDIKINTIKLVYANGKEAFELTQDLIVGDFASSTNVNPKYGTVESLDWEDTLYQVIAFENHKTHVSWFKNSIHYKLRCPFSKEETLKILQSIEY
ncbi:DUF4367 domain-containing protein [Clostridiaceae bacterium 35-E11]